MSFTLRKIGQPSGWVGLAALFAALSYYLVNGDANAIFLGLAALAASALLIYLWAESAAVVKALASRQARRGSNSIVMFVAFLGIIALLNVLAARHSIRWDLTETGAYSLSPQTMSVLGSLRQPVRAIGFYRDGDPQRQQAADLLKEYAARSDKLTYEFIDPDVKPALAQQYQIRDYEVLFLAGDRKQEVLTIGESEFTSALLKVTSSQQKKVAFVTGHGERAVDAADNASYQQAKAALEADNYTTATLSLATGPIPDDVAAVVLAGPKQPLLDQESQVLRDYLANGGKLLLLYDPGVDSKVGDLLVQYGVAVSHDYVIDPARAFFGDAGTPVIDQYGWSPITKDLARLQTVFPSIAPLTTPQQPAPGTTVTALARTSDRSWAEKDIKNPGYTEGSDVKGPLTVAASIEADVKATEGEQPPADKPQKETRLVVVGDSDFASNSFLRMGGNLDFLVNSVNWLTESEELISIRPKPPEDRSVYLNTTQSNLILYTSVFILPLAVLLAGASVWWSRR